MANPPSTFSGLSVVPGDLAAAGFVLLNSDATLQDAEHLNSATAIFKTAVPRLVAGIDAPLPRLLVVGGQLVTIDDDLLLYRATLDVEARARNIGDGKVPDSKTLTKLVKRVCDLVIGHGTLQRAGIRFFDAELDFASGDLISQETVEEATSLARFSVVCRGGA